MHTHGILAFGRHYTFFDLAFGKHHTIFFTYASLGWGFSHLQPRESSLIQVSTDSTPCGQCIFFNKFLLKWLYQQILHIQVYTIGIQVYTIQFHYLIILTSTVRTQKLCCPEHFKGCQEISSHCICRYRCSSQSDPSLQ